MAVVVDTISAIKHGNLLWERGRVELVAHTSSKKRVSRSRVEVVFFPGQWSVFASLIERSTQPS